ncbi:response regulator transcription factor [Streptomyces sp. NBC_00536]|uniref:helix-turn-helix transcriptional regulator n=1 Tax=Streptomyces sp. NBC_00536 TaxID=2975769 RepID=UPI002E808BCB|nr:response regulator transcription factor [Streptomyces sp. NBC_00536]WUC82849.1 response regulator transcription factor [Streptomyces sp. NBC_00536]
MPVLTDRITVTIHAADPLSRAGVVRHLQHQPTVDIVPLLPGRDAPPAPAASVAVMTIDRIDGPSGAALCEVLRGGAQRVLLVARELREPELLAVVEYGVRSIVWRHQATEERLFEAVQRTARGECVLPPDLVDRVLGQVNRLRRSETAAARTGPGGAPRFGLAPRETEVLRLIAEGLDTRRISEKLAYSERTVKNILHGLMTRLQLNNRAHAVAHALREGYI